MTKLFKVNIITPEKTVYAGEVISLIAPGELGYLGILANHAPLITNLVAGKIILKDNTGNPTTINSPGKGFLEVRENNANLILDRI